MCVIAARRGELYSLARLLLAGAMEGSRMCKLLVVGTLVAGALVFVPLNPAGAFVPVQTGVAATAAAMNDVVRVKRHKHGRPHGWSRGRKVGWHGRGRPPGQR